MLVGRLVATMVGTVLGVAVAIVGAALGGLLATGLADLPTAGAIIGGALSTLVAVPYGRVVAACRPYPAGPRGVALVLVDATWSALNTWAGAVFHAVLRLRRAPVDAERSEGSGAIFVTEQAIPGYATTIGIVLAGCSPRLERHERVHVLQARVFGPLYLPLVGLGFVVATVLPYWLAVPVERRHPVRSVRSYFVDGVYRHTWHEWWAYRTAPRDRTSIVAAESEVGTMLGARRGQDELRARVDRLESELDDLRAGGEVIRRLTEDATLLQSLAAEAATTREAAEATLAALRDSAAAAGLHQPRFIPEWNAVYRADSLGLVAAWMRSGRTDRIDLLVGSSDPPTGAVGRGNSRNDINSFVCGIVRPGEFWMLTSEVGPNTGWEAMFTPLS